MKTPLRPKYRAPNWKNMGDSYFSYYDETKTNQEFIQSEVLKKNEKKADLAGQLANATHLHASQFFEDVGAAFKTDCKQGCSHCCHQPATVFAFEAIRIARVLIDTLTKEQLESIKEKMKSRVNGLEGSSVQKNINNKTACPLLENNQCSIYKNRPMTCRVAHSFSVKMCQSAFKKDRMKVEIPVSMELVSAMSGIIEAAFERMPKENLDGSLYELCSAVLAALSNADAAMKWANGDHSVFKNCIKDDT